MSQLTSFFFNLSPEFDPPLQERTNIAEWVEKLIEAATGFIAIGSEGEIIGCAFAYCNDHETKLAYVSILAVSPKSQKSGLGSVLFETLLRSCWEAGMSALNGRFDGKKQWQIDFYQHRFGARQLEQAITDTYPGAVFLQIDLEQRYGTISAGNPTNEG